MATVTNKQRAEAVKQIDTLAVTGTWAANDTFTLTINNKGLVITIGNGTSVDDVAESIRDAWNAQSRLDGQADSTNTNTSNFGGQEFGEFAEVEAVIYTGSTSTVRLIAKTAGKPFTLSTSATTAGDGDVTHSASAQACTGPEWWSNGDNWDGGSVPAASDDIVLANSAIGFKYGLPTNLQIRAGSLKVYQSFTGWLGLPVINRDNPAKHYPEYRTRYPVFFDGDGVTPQSVDIEIGIGDGPGSPLLNIEYDAQVSGADCTFRVFNTGTPQPSLSSHALNIATDQTENNTDYFIRKGHVAIGRRDEGKSSQIRELVVAIEGSQASDVNLLIDSAQYAADSTFVQNGGLVVIRSTSTVDPSSYELNNGVLHWEAINDPTTIDVNAGVLWLKGDATTITIGQRGVVNANMATEGITVTNLDMYAGAQFIDDNDRVTVTNGPDLIRCGIEDVVLRRGKNLRLTKGSVS